MPCLGFLYVRMKFVTSEVMERIPMGMSLAHLRNDVMLPNSIFLHNPLHWFSHSVYTSAASNNYVIIQ
jgi:hypothetical protein